MCVFHGEMDLSHRVPWTNCTELLKFMEFLLFSLHENNRIYQRRDSVVLILTNIARQVPELSQFHPSDNRGHQWSTLCLVPVFIISFRLGAGSVDYCT